METIQLSAPATMGQRTITSLTFQDPKVRHIMAGDGRNPDTIAFAVAIASALTGEPELLIAELPPPDWVMVRTRVNAIYADFSGFDIRHLLKLTGIDGKEKQKENPTVAVGDGVATA